jgi:hypothetical protein
MVRDNYSVGSGKYGNQISVIKGPCGITVNHEDGLPLSLIEIVHGKIIF